MNTKLKSLIYNSILVALYVVITLLCFPISFGPVQFRIAEILILLCFFKKDSIFGLVIGTFIANLFSSIGLWDSLFGTLATLLSCLSIMLFRHLLFALFLPVAINAFVIGAELNILLKEPFWMSSLTVALGEFAVLILGYIVFLILKKGKVLKKLFPNSKNIEFKF